MIAESSRCLLCHQAPCTAACPKGQDPAKGIFSLRMSNPDNAGLWFGAACAGCDGPCEKACVDKANPIRIREVASTVTPREKPAEKDLGIEFCGLHAENPFFLGSAVEASSYEMIARALRQGWAGVFYKTISFIDIKEVSPRFDSVDKGNVTFIGFRNMEQLSEHTPEEDFATIARLKKDFPSKIIAASIMGRTDEEWARLAEMSEKAGADIIECNFSCPQMTEKGTGSDVGQNPELVKHYTSVVKSATKLPVLAKMTPNITHIEEPAAAAIEGGADGIAAINTIKSITLNYRGEVNHFSTISGYSGKAVKPIAQRMILELAQCEATSNTELSGIGGIETWKDAMEYILLGCKCVQVVTSVMHYGYRIIDDLKSGLADFMEQKGETSVEAIRGRALTHFVPAENLDRTTFQLPKIDREKCIGCGRCYISCADGGHQAISFGEDRVPHIIGQKCVGCHLCLLICPSGAISAANRIPKPVKTV